MKRRLPAVVAALVVAGVVLAGSGGVGTGGLQQPASSGGSTYSGSGVSPISAAVVNAGFVDAGNLYVPGYVNTVPAGLQVLTDFYVLAGNDAILQRDLRVNGNLSLNGVLADSSTAVTLTGGCTSPTVTWSNGSAEFQFDVGSSCSGVSTITVTLPTAAHGWTCSCWDTGAVKNVRQSGGSTTTAVITNYGTSVATPADWADGADIRCACRGG